MVGVSVRITVSVRVRVSKMLGSDHGQGKFWVRAGLG